MKDEIEKFKKGMKEVRSPLQKAVGHPRRERHNTAKKKAMAKKMTARDAVEKYQKHLKTDKGRMEMWKRDGVYDKDRGDNFPENEKHPDQASWERRNAGKKIKDQD